MASRFLCAFGLIGIAFAYSKFVHQILPNRSELFNEVSIICPYNNSVLESEKQKRQRRSTFTASFAMPDARSNRSGRRRRPDNQQCRATGFTYISPPSPSFPICYEKNMRPLQRPRLCSLPNARGASFCWFYFCRSVKMRRSGR